MNKMNFFLLVAILLFSLACGQSEEQKKIIEKQKQDSIVKATEKSVYDRIEADKRKTDSIQTAKRDSQARSAEKLKIEQQISNSITGLRLAKEKLNSIKEFQIGRTKAEKEAQIAAQYTVIQSWEDQLRVLNEQLEKYK